MWKDWFEFKLMLKNITIVMDMQGNLDNTFVGYYLAPQLNTKTPEYLLNDYPDLMFLIRPVFKSI